MLFSACVEPLNDRVLMFSLTMSAADIAVRVFLKLEPEDFRTLQAIELAMTKHEYAPVNLIPKLANLNPEETEFRLNRLEKQGLIQHWTGPYSGYTLNMAGYDSLAINALVKADILEAFGKPLGIGKEADVYDALTPDREQVAVKFHRLGRISFRQTKRKRGYIAERLHTSWLYQSRLAAQKEYEALKLLESHGIAAPKPVSQNRHVIVMSLIEGAELFHYPELPDPQAIMNEILENVRKAYQEAGIIHADLSEYNIILQPNQHILIIDWPQYVRADHPNAEQLLQRDVKNVSKFFQRKFGLKTKLKDAVPYVKTAATTFLSKAQ